MNHLKILLTILSITIVFTACENEKSGKDYSGTYCLNIQNMEMTILQKGNEVTFTLQQNIQINGKGIMKGDTLIMTANTSPDELFSCYLTFSEDGNRFTGHYQVTGINDRITSEGILLGDKGKCPEYDIEANGIPKFIEEDFTQLSDIEMISKFRSGFGHSYTDGFETCRSMKHYYSPYKYYRENNTVEIHSPVNGTIVSVLNDNFGASIGLNNKQIQIRPDDQPAFICTIFHCDLNCQGLLSLKTYKMMICFGRNMMPFIFDPVVTCYI
jgi:hypothetical protein